MAAEPEQLHALLMYCIDFARTMLDDRGEFYPFGAVLNAKDEIEARGAWDGSERPIPSDIYKLMADSFRVEARTGNIFAAALAVNVNVPPQYSSPHPDALRVSLESVAFSRFIYVPYKIDRTGILKQKRVAKFAEPFSVEVEPTLFKVV